MHTGSLPPETLVMTSAIDTPQLPFLKIQNHGVRLHQTLCSLLAWLEEPGVGTIILCDGTMVSFDFSPLVAYARKQGKKLEVLRFNESEDVMSYGKGYGEGEVLRYAIEHSAHLSNDAYFFKVTGRTYVQNFQEVRDSLAGKPVAFSLVDDQLRSKHAVRWFVSRVLARLGMRTEKTDGKKMLWTQFYKMNVGFYKKHLLESYRHVRDRDGYYIEHAFYDSLEGVPYAPITTTFQIVGLSGTSGCLYGRGDFPQEIQRQATQFLTGSVAS